MRSYIVICAQAYCSPAGPFGISYHWDGEQNPLESLMGAGRKGQLCRVTARGREETGIPPAYLRHWFG